MFDDDFFHCGSLHQPSESANKFHRQNNYAHKMTKRWTIWRKKEIDGEIGTPHYMLNQKTSQHFITFIQSRAQQKLQFHSRMKSSIGLKIWNSNKYNFLRDFLCESTITKLIRLEFSSIKFQFWSFQLEKMTKVCVCEFAYLFNG